MWVCVLDYFFFFDNSVRWTTSLKKDSQLKILFCLALMKVINILVESGKYVPYILFIYFENIFMKNWKNC